MLAFTGKDVLRRDSLLSFRLLRPSSCISLLQLFYESLFERVPPLHSCKLIAFYLTLILLRQFQAQAAFQAVPSFVMLSSGLRYSIPVSKQVTQLC